MWPKASTTASKQWGQIMTNSIASQQAQEWYLKVNGDSVTAGELFQFNTWLEQPENARAYEQFEELDNCFATLQNSREGELLIRHRHASTRRAKSYTKPSKLWWPWTIPGAALFATVCVFFLSINHNQVINYSTATGEIRTVTLPDNSKITLSPETSLSVELSQSLRVVNHHEGPAQGTEFSVNTKRQGFEVKVHEGHVNVSESSQEQVVRLTAGTEVSAINTDTLGLRKESQYDDLYQWKQGILVYRDTPLQVILGEINSYTTQNLYVNSASLAETRISLSINLDDLEGLPELLSQLLPIEVVPDSYGKIMLLERN